MSDAASPPFSALLGANNPITVARVPCQTGAPSQANMGRDTCRALDANEVARVLTRLPALSADRPWRSLGPRLALWTGLHVGEIALLRTDDLQWRGSRPWLTVRSPPRGRQPGHERSVPVHPDLEALPLADVFSQVYFRRSADGPLFPDLAYARRPGDALDSWLRRTMRPLAKDGRHAPTMHDLRMTCARGAAQGGASMEAVEALMGRYGNGADAIAQLTGEAAQRTRDALMLEAVLAVDHGSHWPPVLPEAKGPESAQAGEAQPW